MLGALEGTRAARDWRKSRRRNLHCSSKTRGTTVPLTIEVEQEEDGRWLAEVPELPGVLSYGPTRREAIEGVQVLALRVLADRLDHGESVPQMSGVFAVTP